MNKIFYLLRQTIYTLFALCYFLGFALDMTVRGFFILTLGGASDEHKLRYHRILQRKARYVINHVPGSTFSFHNHTGETFEKPAVIICNHQSHLDLMAIMMLTPRLIILTKDWVWRNPFYGLVIRYADYFPVSETEQMNKKIKTMLAKGYSVVVFPEGTRSEDCRIRRFHRGAFYIAEQHNLDIVPIFIDGLGEVLPKKARMLRPGDMKMEVMPRISREELSQLGDYRVVTRKMHDIYMKKKA